MTTRRIAVITAGIGTPSSTRPLADRLGAAAGEALRSRGVPVRARVRGAGGLGRRRPLGRRARRPDRPGELAELVAGRPAAVPGDPFATPTPFADLLAQG